jgi:hypothetical protein
LDMEDINTFRVDGKTLQKKLYFQEVKFEFLSFLYLNFFFNIS